MAKFAILFSIVRCSYALLLALSAEVMAFAHKPFVSLSFEVVSREFLGLSINETVLFIISQSSTYIDVN